jgi:hypothetical protein
MLHRKIYVASQERIPYKEVRSELAPPLLGRFLPKLGGTSVPPFFFAIPPRSPDLSPAEVAATTRLPLSQKETP